MANTLGNIVMTSAIVALSATASVAGPVARAPLGVLSTANMHRLRPPALPPPPRVSITAADRLRAKAGGWQPVAATAPFGSSGAGTALLMTDGTVMISDNEANWYSLAPDNTGNYIKGTWTHKASLPSGYGPLYFASAVLADGNLVVNGGEYNFLQSAETNRGAIYNPLSNTWKSITPPAKWSSIGDAQSVVLANGTYMIGNCCLSVQALLDEKALTWTITGAKKADGNSEEGWTLLPSGGVLAADVGAEPNSEIYNPASGIWTSAGKLPANLTQSFEIGPQMLRPDGTVFVAGADAYTAVYSLASGTWTAGPNFPIIAGQQVDIADGPETLLTNGTVLMAASAGVYTSPSYFFEFNGKTLTRVPAPPNAPNNSSYNYRLLLLPTGQVLATDSSSDVEIFTPSVKPDRALAPVIGSVATTLTHGNTYPVSGTGFNGVSQANAYGDDAQAATNYPLVAITNLASGHVVFARTHDHSSMAVRSSATVSTQFDVPSDIEVGASALVVVTNGIQSAPIKVTIK